MAESIKVLNINKVSDEYGGVPIFLMNVYKNMDHDKYQLDFLTPDTTSYNPWREEIESTGGNIFEFHINCESSRGIIKFGRRLKIFLMIHNYDIVHINCGAVLFDYITARVAKKSGAKVVVHSHNSGNRSWWKNLPIFFLKCRMQKKANILCACSLEAAKNLFTARKVDIGEVHIINNGIDLNKFHYDQERRSKIRQELKIDDCFVIGHIGRFVEQKNHEFLIDIFAGIIKKQPLSLLILIGQGEMEAQIQEKVHNLNLDKNILFLGNRNDVADLYQAMDVFLFPSVFEGLPISLVEAQVSGLPCCISDTISKEVDLTSLVHRISLKSLASEWAENVLSIQVDSDLRKSFDQELQKEGYGIDTTVARISQLYESILRE